MKLPVGARRPPAGSIVMVIVSMIIAGACGSPAASDAVEATVSASQPVRATPSIDLSAEPSDQVQSIPLPPDAALAVDGGDPVIGALGSFAWDNAGSSSPWLPGTPIHVGRGEVLFMALSEAVRLENWTVNSSPGGTPGEGIEGLAEGVAGMVRFSAPPPGTWSVNVDVWFADGLGSASYYWLIEVE